VGEIMKKVLFVTNEPKYVSIWKNAITSNEFEFDVALSAAEAIARAESGNPNIIVIDRTDTAPEVFINSIKQNKKTANINVIKITPDQSPNPDAAIARIKAILAPKKVLIAEDDRQMAGVIELILTTSGFVVKNTYDGVETLREIKTWRPHMLVLDIMLPLVDGFHICQTMNEDHSFDPKPKILIVSGRGSDWDQNLGAACGAEDYIVKPFKNEIFIQKVREILNS
jgi:DNA-binding response OmpR family regulator